MLLNCENKCIQLKNECLEMLFIIEDCKIFIKEISFFGKKIVNCGKGTPHSFVFLSGGAYVGRHFNRYGNLGENLEFAGYSLLEKKDKRELIIEENNEKISVKTVYELYAKSAVLNCRKEIVNHFDRPLVIEAASPLTLYGVMTTRTDASLPYLWKGHNTQCAEAMFEKSDLRLEGLRGVGRTEYVRPAKVSVSGNGTQSTNRYLPMGILEKEKYGFLAFELSPFGSWHYELEAGAEGLCLSLTGRSLADNGWYKILQCGETYKTESVRITGSEDIDDILAQLTEYRRKVWENIDRCIADKIVYNNFMENTYDHPTEEIDEICINAVAEYGADYYVIDAGWHDKGLSDSPTREIGEWKENPYNYPSGLAKTIDKIRQSGMKFGFWVEIQSIGIHCRNDFLPEEYFFHLGGVRTGCHGRYQLDFSKEQVREHATNVIRGLVEKYAPDYIKIDYNQTQPGNDCNTGSFVEGVALHCKAYNEWLREIQDAYPDIVFESCSSGGMCMDAESTANTTVMSFSDMPTYFTVPYTVANQFMAILPEQLGIWCMPVRKNREQETTDENVIMNMVNALYGVMHFASRVDYLTNKQKTLVKEGMAYYRELAKIKTKAFPVLPGGLVNCDDEVVCMGLLTDEKLYLSIYNMSEREQLIEQDLEKYGVKNSTLTYPVNAGNFHQLEKGIFRCSLCGQTARAFEFEREKK